MDKKYFFIKLIPCRPDFSQTMTDVERGIMMQHIVYWKALMAKGKVVVFGPVMEPAGAYGMGVVQADEVKELEEFLAGDPAGSINKYEYYPMRAVLPE
jgi:hypothetical protein